MQPMPAKTRTAVMVGAALLAVIVVSVAFWSSRRSALPNLPADELALTEEPYGLLPTQPGVTAATVQPNQADPTPTHSGATLTPSGATPTAGLTVPKVHTVAPGDTLSSISRQYYKTHIYAGDIEALNELTDPDHLELGKQLRLPDPQTLATGN